jgi:hypothetical protein
VNTLPRKVIDSLFQDAMERDLTTRRRAALLGILWNERYLTRMQLIMRVEYKLGKGCFGVAAWQDTFFRDMRVVKQTFAAAGLDLMYSRTRGFRGYYVAGQDALSPEFKRMIQSSVGEVDSRQIGIYRSLSPAARFAQGCAISDAARNVVAYRIKQQNPGLTPQEAQKLALQRAYNT